jgi:Restriction endonuclease
MPAPLDQRPRHRLRRDDSATIEHVLPRALGGGREWLNEVAACRACNSAKADRLPLPIQLWRLAWLKGAPLAAHADDPAALAALLAGTREERGEGAGLEEKAAETSVPAA